MFSRHNRGANNARPRLADRVEWRAAENFVQLHPMWVEVLNCGKTTLTRAMRPGACSALRAYASDR
jgi:hypothetical protein